MMVVVDSALLTVPPRAQRHLLQHCWPSHCWYLRPCTVGCSILTTIELQVPLLVEHTGTYSVPCNTASSWASLEPFGFEMETLVEEYTQRQISRYIHSWSWMARCLPQASATIFMKGICSEIRRTSSAFRSDNWTGMLSRSKLLALAWAGNTHRFKALWHVL